MLSDTVSKLESSASQNSDSLEYMHTHIEFYIYTKKRS